MKYSQSLQFVVHRAKYFKSEYFQDKEERVEHYFLSVLFFVSMDMTKRPPHEGERKSATCVLERGCCEPIEKMKGILTEACQKRKEELWAAKDYLTRAEALAESAKAAEVSVVHLLSVMLENPSPAIDKCLKFNAYNMALPKQETPKKEVPKKEAPKKEVLNKSGNEEKAKKNPVGALEQILKSEREKNVVGLTNLAKKIDEMARFISKDLKGQDHAIKAVADGYFNAEVLVRTEGERKRPKMTYLFAGPPGVGKTFMAEKMAEYLKLPHLCVDMSTCADHQMGPMVFIGEQPSFTKAQSGIVTSFVKENPKCVLIFDEIEKAHVNVLHLFYQMLDRGVLQDLKLNEDISFKDTIIIITTNVGHNLYEGKEEENISMLPAKTVLKALKTDINPKTKEPFFPEALVSRMGRGTVLVFDHLKSHYLQEIVQAELSRNANLFQEQYGMEVTFDDKIASLIMYREGGIADARTLTAKAANFFKTQILHCLELFDLEKVEQLLTKFDKLHFYAEDWNELEQLNPVFQNAEIPEILLYGNESLGQILKKNLQEFRWNITDDNEAAVDICMKKEIEAIFVDPIEKEVLEEQKAGDSLRVFDKVNLNANAFKNTWDFVEKISKKFPGTPIYLLDRNIFALDKQIEFKMVQRNIREIIDVKDSKIDTYKKQIEICLKHSQLQKIAMFLQSKHQMVKYEISPYWHESSKELDIRCRNFALGDLIDVEDQEFIVSDAERPDIKFQDVVGAGAAKEELQFFIEYLKKPKQFIAKGLKPPKGLLFYGPPGTGKTMLAKAMAGETDITFLTESASNFVKSLAGSGPEAIQNMFRRARRYAPAILFIDEIDAIGRTRTGGAGSHNEEATLNSLLTEMDGFKVDLKRPVFIIAATNFKVDEGKSGTGYIDPALVRRFDRKILIDLPNKAERLQLLTMLCKKVEACQVSSKLLENLAGRSIGLSNANLSNVVSHAVRMAERKDEALTDEILEEAFETSVYGEKKNWGQEVLERVAWHEAGHAYMYWKHGNVPSYLTIVARGNHGGYMQHDDTEAGAPLRTHEELLNSIRVSLAGRAGEILRYGKESGVSTGIAEDLRQATKTAKRIICNYGMDDEIGMIYIDSDVANQSEIAMLVHKKAVAILNQQMEQTIRELQEGRTKIERLVRALMDKNSMTGEEIDQILKMDL